MCAALNFRRRAAELRARCQAPGDTVRSLTVGPLSCGNEELDLTVDGQEAGHSRVPVVQ